MIQPFTNTKLTLSTLVMVFAALVSKAQCPRVFDFYGQTPVHPYWYSCSGNDFSFNLSTPNSWGEFTINWGDGSPVTSGASWSPPTFQTHLYSAAVTTYTVTITETSSGCTVTGTVVMEEATSASIQIPVGGVTQACAPQTMEFINSSTNVSGTTQFTWDFGDGSNSTGFEETHPYNSVGIFTVSLTETSDLGCSSTYTVNISNTDDLLENNMPNIILFPNPADESLQLSIDIADRIEIIDAFGRVVYNVSQLNALNGININTKQLSAGKYLVKIEKDNLLGTFPLMIYHD